MDQDLWSKALNFHGSPLLQTVLDKVPEPKNDSEKEKQLMCNFISKRTKMLFKYSKEIPGDLPEHSMPIVPIEVFRDVSAEERRDLFYKSLDRGHILILRVINDTLPDNYKLLVLCKEENHMKLDDLSIIMFLPKLPAELDLAGGKLESNDLIKAAVCSCSIDERKLYVTLDSNVLEDDSEKVVLGKIAEEDLPFYVGKVDLGPSYVECLYKTPVLHDVHWPDYLRRFLNLKDNYLYSFMEGLDGKTYDPCVYAAELRKRQVIALSQANYEAAIHCYEEGDFPTAFMHFKKAITVNPKNVEAFVARGILFSNTNNVKRAFKDFEAALNLDPKNEKASQQMSLLLVAISRTHIEHNNLLKARESLEAALYVDTKNQDAIAVYEQLQKLESAEKSSDKPVKASVSGKKDRSDSPSSDKTSSTKFDSNEDDDDDDDLNKNFDLEAATKKFLSSMQEKTEQDKDKKIHRAHHKSKSKSPIKNLLP